MNKYRIGTDVPFQLSVDDGVEYLDLSKCTILNVAMYCDAQEAFAGSCTWQLNADDHTRLDCVYPGDRQVYTGIMRAVVVMVGADGGKKAYDLADIFEIVATTEEANATEDTVTSAVLSAWQLPMSTLSTIVEAAINATEAASGSVISEISYTESTEDDGNNVLHIKQEDGTEYVFNIKNGSQGSEGIQGEQGPRGPQGEQGNPGSSVDYPFELVNNLTTDDATKGLSAAMGVQLEGEITQLEAEVTDLTEEAEGETILSYSGAQSIRTLSEEVTDETLAVVRITGNIGDIKQVSFLSASSTNLLTLTVMDWTQFYVPIPATTKKIGIYEKTGKTLSISITVETIGLKQELELAERENGLVIDRLGWTNRVCSFYNAVKCVRYYAPENLNVSYVRSFGFFTNKIQLTVSYNKSTNIDFTTPASERPTGVKTHILTNADKQIVITVNWDVLSEPVSDGLYCLGIRINDYSGAIVPTINEKIEKAVQELDLSRIEETSEQVGEGIGASNLNNSWLYCPNKSFTKDGYLSEIGFMAGADCTLTVYVGELDQRYLFIPRSSHSFACVSGDNVLDVESQKIAVYAGEYVAFMASTGGVKFNNATAGDPLSENSFLYTANGSTNLFQLQVYAAQKIFKINFYAKTTTDVFIQQTLESLKLQAQISTMGETVGSISSSLGTVNDAQGNKYRLKVVNGAVVAIPLNFRNVLCVGNSFTVHPTTDDAGAAFATAYWWGHWAMAASSPNVAWTKLLQNSLRVNQNDAVVTPIFGRPYETGAYNLTDNDAFVYWENGTRKSLKANLASFSGVDCIVFFLGDNYTGSDWETKFNAMCEQFATWFPSASIYCVGAVVSSSVSAAIQNVASAKGYPFIDVLSIKTQPLRSREGNFVLGDDNALHQINYSAVGNHFGDYGQFKLNEKIATAIGATPVAVAYAVTLESQLLTLLQYNYLEDSIVSIFADDTVNSITVVDADNNAINATSHSTDYGKIFTFTMPASDVSVSAVTS